MPVREIDAGPLAGPQHFLAGQSIVLRNGENVVLVPSPRTLHAQVLDPRDGHALGTLLRSEALRLVLEGEVRVGPAVYRLDPEHPLTLITQPRSHPKYERPSSCSSS